MLPQWFLVGAGRCGVQLARAIEASGLEVAGVEVRSPRGRARVRRALPGVRTFGAAASLPPVHGVLIAVPDSAIPACAARLAPRLHPATSVVLHTSGLLTADALAAIAAAGPTVGSFHPMASFPTATGPLVRLAGVVAAVEGRPAAVREARRLALALGMRPVRIAAAAKPSYHAAAALAANLTHALVATAKDVLTGVGFTRRGAAAALRPLVAGAVEAALSARGMERLTGPLGRGDAEAVLAHLAALPGGAAAAYRAVAAVAVAALSEEGLLPDTRIRDLKVALTGHRRCARFQPLT
ncbi:MAG: DUF2520 domain-containing protein [Acidobacteria bacterium]|nr:MAG: DUF2520 domain-containing protein [Acidobacteriota bacterium]